MVVHRAPRNRSSWEVKRIHGRACVIRLHGPDGSAQFVAQLPAREVSEALDTYVRRADA